MQTVVFETSRLSEIAWPLFAFFCVLLGGVAMTVYRLVEQPYKADVTLVVGMWNVLNVLLAGCAATLHHPPESAAPVQQTES